MDHVQQLAESSGLPVGSHVAAEAAWNLLVQTARGKWPTVKLDETVLATFVGERLVGDDIATALGLLPAADLAIAAACVAQEPTALDAFDAILTEVDAAGAATNSPKDLVDEVKQLLRLQLLVPRDGKPPALAGYRGKGPLRGWVRITATRELIRHKKKGARERPSSDSLDRRLDDMIVSGVDPGLAALKAEYRAEFKHALHDAIADLSAEDRTLLRLQIVDGMSIDAVGAAYGVHRATAARWLTRARNALVGATHTRLADRLKLPVEQMESVIKLVSSQLDASVIRYLGE